jgi:hypothetical protein
MARCPVPPVAAPNSHSVSVLAGQNSPAIALQFKGSRQDPTDNARLNGLTWLDEALGRKPVTAREHALHSTIGGGNRTLASRPYPPVWPRRAPAVSRQAKIAVAGLRGVACLPSYGRQQHAGNSDVNSRLTLPMTKASSLCIVSLPVRASPASPITFAGRDPSGTDPSAPALLPHTAGPLFQAAEIYAKLRRQPRSERSPVS